jgi:hypothetical protein
MAKTKPRKGRNGNIAEFPGPTEDSEASDATVASQDPPETAQAAPDPPAEPEPPPRKPGSRNLIPKVLTFFQQISKIPLSDWGTRAKIRVYRLEPIIDMRRGSNNKYICIYTEPVDEERIKRDLGSGRYRLYLNFKNPGAQEERELDSVEFDILDRNFPPVIPDGSWVDDPINKKWAWAKPPDKGSAAAAASSASGNMLEAVQVLGDIQDRAEDRARERMDSGRQQTWNPAEQLATVVTAAKDIAGALRATPENPIPAFISEQMTAMRAEIAAARQRSDALMDKMLDMARAPQQQQQNTGMSAIKELVTGVKDLLPSLKELWPNADEAIADRVVRSKMGPWQEFFAPVLPRLVDALGPILPGIVMSMGGTSNRPPGPPAQFAPGLPSPQPNPSQGIRGVGYGPGMTPPPPPPQTQHAPNLDEMLLNALTNDREGGEFADSLIMLFGQQGQLMYRQAASLGEQGLLTLIQQRPIWHQLGPLQSKVAQFVKEFIEYGQEPPEEPPQGAEPPATDAEVVDLTGEPA